ncbi:hypothetical protein [uncultured Algibacter sp.]|uniref:hypothetical protein n=1 Tax=uncultured Algibacter sp. TaxID=298659 RepID=UPI002636FFA6|nr:hypothetical protein [uncultured Algibacter sp.]
MGGEGSIMAANNSLKNNRCLLSKRREKGALGGGYANIELKELPKSTPEKLLEIRQRLKRENKNARIKNIALFLVLIFGTVALVLSFNTIKKATKII